MIQADKTDVTERLVFEAKGALGKYGDIFRKATPAKPGKLTATQQAALAKFSGEALGPYSNVLLYADQLRYSSVSERRAFASLCKGGMFTIYMVSAPHPAPKSGFTGEFHYVLESKLS